MRSDRELRDAERRSIKLCRTATPRFRRAKRVPAWCPDLVGAKDIALECDARGRRVDQPDHGVEGGGSVAKKRHAIATRDVGRRQSPEAQRERWPGSDGIVTCSAAQAEFVRWDGHRGVCFRMHAFLRAECGKGCD
jgi:hypothetical protein